jgi:hypothetical protein
MRGQSGYITRLEFFHTAAALEKVEPYVEVDNGTSKRISEHALVYVWKDRNGLRKDMNIQNPSASNLLAWERRFEAVIK